AELRVGVPCVHLNLPWLSGSELRVEVAGLRIGVGPRPLPVANDLLVELATSAARVLLRLRTRHPGAAAVLCACVLGLDALVGHDHTILVVCTCLGRASARRSAAGRSPTTSSMSLSRG